MTTVPTTTFLELIDKISLLRQIDYFSELSEDQLQRLAAASDLKSVPKHRFIFRQGEVSDKIYVLVNGTVKLGNYSADDKEVIKTLLHPRALFGESSLSKEGHRNSFAKSIDVDVRYVEINVKVFIELMSENFSFNMRVVEHLSGKILKAEERLQSLVFNDARTRIIDFIKENAKNFGHRVGLETLLKHSLTQQDIANYTGTSRQTVTSVLNELKKSNQIHFRRKRILIRDIETLV